MGLKEIVEALERECERTIKEIEERALVQAQRIREEAREKAEKAKEELLASEKKKIEQEVRNILNDAEAKARRIKAEAREKMFQLVFEEMKKIIQSDRKIAESVYRMALMDALSYMNGSSEKPVLAVSKNDREIVEKIIAEAGMEKLSVSETNGISSGFVLSSGDGKTRYVVNSELIAGRLARQYLSEISKRLFE
jgi:vacuolar-type H+-ATPase subunit E/Vma4